MAIDRFHDVVHQLYELEFKASVLRTAIESGYVPSDVVLDNIMDSFKSICVADEHLQIDCS